MLDSAPRSQESVDRHGVVAYFRRLIAQAEAMPRDALHRRSASPAGLPLELYFDDSAQADLYGGRLAEGAFSTERRPTRIYVLNHQDALAAWGDPGCDAAQFHVLLQAAGLRAAYPFLDQVWQVLDIESGIGVQIAGPTAEVPQWFSGAPLRQHLHWLLRAEGRRLAHAASLGRDGRGILLLGHGGAGKSGTALAGIAAGLQSVGDDYIALGGLSPPVAEPLFRLMKQDRAGLTRIERLFERTAGLPKNWKGKIEFDPTGIFPGCFANALEIAAIVLPNVAHAPQPQLAEIGGGEAMRALMRSNLFQFPGEPDDGMEYYATLLRGLPAYRLDLSDSAAANGGALVEFIARLPVARSRA